MNYLFIILTIITLVNSFVLYLFIRELFLLKESVVTEHARRNTSAPPLGSNIQSLIKDTALNSIKTQKLLCLIFVLPGCPACERVKVPKLRSVKSAWREKFHFLQINHDNEIRMPEVGIDLPSNYEISSESLFLALNITVTPYVLIFSPDWTLLSGGLVNNPLQVENLLESVE